MKKVILIFLASFLSASAMAQSICGFDGIHQSAMQRDPAYRAAIEANNTKLRQYIALNGAALRTSVTTYTIPVVVHVVHTGGAIGSIYNPDDATIIATINYLNQVFKGTAAGMSGGVGDMGLQFVLAQRDPNCNATSGIDRVDGTSLSGYVANGVSYPTPTNNTSDLNLKNQSRWDPTKYYNIWVVNKIDGNDGTAGQFTGGYAYFPGSGNSDGTVMLATQMKVNNKTIPHEMGHAFSLYHPFEGSADSTQCPTNNNCISDGDRVCDTDPVPANFNLLGQLNQTCRTGINPCTNTNYSINTESNFMGYTNCYTLFTPGQRDRVQATLLTSPSRISLVNSRAGLPCSNDANLSNLSINGSSISPTFSASTFNYTAPVTTNASISINVTKSSPYATLQGRINGGSYSTLTAPVINTNLAVGENVIDFKVTAENGTTTNTYTITISRPAIFVTSFSPANATPGSSITITGIGFNTTTANNIVFFGATRATVTAATATSITVTVPVGATYAPITILNTGTGLAAYSLANFTPVYTPSKTSITASDFLPKQDLTAGLNPYSVAIGDLDGDGKPDLAVVNSNSATVSVYRNTSTSGSIGSSSFAAKVDFATGSSPFSVAIGDLDGDGKPDLAIANNNSNTVSILRNTATSGSIGTGSFAAKVDFTTGSGPRWVAIGDLDGDGKLDLAIANYNSSTVSVFRNTSSTGIIGSGSFATKVDFATGTNPFSVAIGDLDGDGKLDLAVANTSSNTVSIFRNTALSGTINTGSFETKQDYTAGNSPYSLALGDLDGDGKLDVAVANYYSSTVSVFRNTSSTGSIGSGSFAAKVDFSTNTNTFSVAIGDLDGDGKPDLAVTNSSSSTVSVFRNTSTSGSISSGSLAANQDFTTGSSPFSVAIGDLDGDGKPDLATANFASTSVSVILNASKNANLSALSISSGSLSPAFNSATTSYSVSVNNATTNIAVTPTVADANATVQVRINAGTYTSVTSGNASSPLALNVGNNLINVNVTAQDGTTIKAYNITVSRISNNANLSSLILSTGTLNPTFNSATTSYAAIVSNTTTSITVRPTVANQDATVQVRVNGGSYATVNSGNTSNALALNVGNNTIDINVTAQDGTTIKTYTIEVTRQYPFSITSFSPASAKPGDVVTITGTNFSTTASHNIVFFGATAGTVNTASATSLVVTVPTGATYAPITLINTEAALFTNSSSNFIPVFTPSKSSITSSDFLAKVDFTTGSNPQAVAIGDIDGDGKPDLVTANNGTNRVSVFLNTSTSGTISSGSFAAKVDFVTGTSPVAIAIGDLSGDGKLDLAVVNSGSNTVSIFQNASSTGGISFATKVDFTTGNNPQAVAIGDIDGDGKPELVVANSSSNTISVLLNTTTFGSIAFATKVDFTLGTGLSPDALAIGDLDGDSKPDIAVVNNGNNSVSVFRNTATSGTISSGSLAARVNFTTGTNPQAITLGDLDGDDKLDLAVANNGSRTVSVFRNTATSGAISTSSFATKVDFTSGGSGTSPQAVAIGDLNGDGKPDLAVTSSGSISGNIASIFRNTATSGSITAGSFAAKVDFATGTIPVSLAIGDLDGDGKPDLAVANLGSNTFSVLRNADIPTWDGSTWLGGSPSVLTDAIIASSIAPSSFTCQALTINSGVSLTTTGITFTVNGDIINDGNGIAGTGSLVIAANSSISGNTISFNGTLTVNSGATLTTNNKLTISSNATATGRIANSAGTITGNVTVERYITAGKRGFRFLTPTVTTTNFIKANWQEGATSSTANPTPGYGTHITGATVDQTNGFDGTTTGAASMFTFNNATQAWNTGIANTNTTNLIAGNAYRILVRGNRSFDLTTTSVSNTATTLRATGTLITGAVSFRTASSTPSSLPTLASNANEYSFIGNPYASPIDWNALTKTGLTGYYYIWDPTIGTRGAYVSCFTDGTKSNGSSNITTAIQSGQAFFVQNTSGASARQLDITEANKTAGNTNVFRTTTGTSSLGIQLFLTANMNGTSQDGATVLFNNNYSNTVNDEDASKFTNQDENIAVQRGNRLMSIERRNVPAQSDTVQLKVWQLTQNNYTFRIAANNFDGSVNAYLQDNYLNNETLLNLNGTTDVNFTTTPTVATTATDRFRIVFRTNNALPATFLNVTAAQKNAGIEVVWNTANEVNMNSYEVEESKDGVTFTKAVSVAAKNATTNSYTWFDASVINGENYYRIKAVENNGAIKYSNVVKVKIGGKKTEFTVYPNPVKGGTLSLQMSNVEKGIYTVKIYNNLGQELTAKTINHNGGSATQTIDVSKGIASGTYNMQITNGTTVITKTIIVE